MAGWRTSVGRGTSSGRKRTVAAVLLGAVLLTGCGADSPEQMLASAKSYLAKSDFDAASIQLKNAVQKDGGLAEARYLLGVVYLEQGDVAAAVRELRRAEELGFEPVRVAPQLARALVLAGEFDGVIEAYGDVVLDDAVAQARLLGAVGDAHLGKGEIESAKSRYEAALEANPDDAVVRVGLGRSKAFLGDVEGALADADAALALDPEYGPGHALRADLLSASGRIEDAVSAWDAALKAQPRAIGHHFAVVSLLLRENDLDRAENRLEAMVKLAPKHPTTLYAKAFIDFRRDRVVEARDGVAEIIRVMPDYLPARLLAGSIHLRLGDHVRAQEDLGRVLAIAPGQDLARRLLVTSLLATGEPVRAKTVLQPLLDAGVGDQATLTLAGQTFLATGEFERASEFFAQAVAAAPDDAEARTRLGIARLAGGDAERAFADLEAASVLDEGAGQPEAARALAHVRRGELDKALVAQQELERKQPDNPQTYNLKGGILLEMKDLAGARTAFERAVELKPDFVAAVVNLARIDLAEQRVGDARKRFEALIAARPGNPEAYLLMADLLSNTGAKPEDVLAVLVRAGAASPTALAPKLALARHFLVTKEARKALVAAQEAAAAYPSDPQAVAMLGQALLESGEHQQAIATFNRLVNLQPRLPGPLVALSDAQLATGEKSGAEQSLRRALAIQSNLVEAQGRLVSLMVSDNRIEDALKIARDVQRQRVDAPLGYVLEGDVHAAAQQWVQAIPAYGRALQVAMSPELAIRLHAAQLQAGKPEDADRTAERWLREHPDDVAVRGYLAERALSGNRLEVAEKLYRRMIEVRPDNALVLNNLAWVAGQLKRPDALALAERAHELEPRSAAILDTLGMLQMERGEHEKGLVNLRRAVELAPAVGNLRLNLARAYITMDRKGDARSELDSVLEKAAEGSPLHAEASRWREGL